MAYSLRGFGSLFLSGLLEDGVPRIYTKYNPEDPPNPSYAGSWGGLIPLQRSAYRLRLARFQIPLRWGMGRPSY